MTPVEWRVDLLRLGEWTHSTVTVLALLFLPLSVAAQQGGQASEGDRDWSLLPFALYSPETSLGFGILFARIQDDPDGRFRSSLILNGMYTLKNQASVGWGYDYRPRKDWMILSDGSGKLSWPDRLYPPGNRTGRDAYEDWTSRGLDFRLKALRQFLHPDFFLGPVLGLYHFEVLELEEGGLLDLGVIPGNEDHGLMGLGLSGTWDSRDSQVYPRNGGFHSLSVMGFRGFHGGPRQVGRVEADLRSYRSLGTSLVLALRTRIVSAWGDVPFTLNTGIGGQGGGIRGIYENRYSDRAAAVAVAELRFPIRGRLGGVAFGGLGKVAPKLDRLSLKGLHGSAGAGLRFALMPASGLNVGVDFGMGEGESGVYFLLGEAF